MLNKLGDSWFSAKPILVGGWHVSVVCMEVLTNPTPQKHHTQLTTQYRSANTPVQKGNNPNRQLRPLRHVKNTGHRSLKPGMHGSCVSIMSVSQHAPPSANALKIPEQTSRRNFELVVAECAVFKILQRKLHVKISGKYVGMSNKIRSKSLILDVLELLRHDEHRNVIRPLRLSWQAVSMGICWYKVQKLRLDTKHCVRVNGSYNTPTTRKPRTC